MPDGSTIRSLRQLVVELTTPPQTISIDLVAGPRYNVRQREVFAEPLPPTTAGACPQRHRGIHKTAAVLSEDGSVVRPHSKRRVAVQGVVLARSTVAALL